MIRASLSVLLAFLLCGSAASCAARRQGPARDAAIGEAAATTLAASDTAPVTLHVVYPREGSALTARDSTFIFGSVSPAGVPVTVNGVPARQAASGGWLAYVPIVRAGDTRTAAAQGAQPDSIVGPASRPAEPAAGQPAVFEVEAGGVEGPHASLTQHVRIPRDFEPNWNGVLDSTTVSPREEMELHPGDPLVVRFKGVRGLEAGVMLEGWDPDSLPLQEHASASFLEEPSESEDVAEDEGRRVFDVAGGQRSRQGGGAVPDTGTAGWSWYRAALILPPTVVAKELEGCVGYRGSLAAQRRWPAGATSCRKHLAIVIAHEPAPLRYPLRGASVLVRDPSVTEVVTLDDDIEDTGRTDGRVVGRTAPDGVYFLFFPNGTRARAERRVGSSLELRLASDLSVWADVKEARSLARDVPPSSRVPVVRTRRVGRWTRILLPLRERLPVQIRQQTRPARYQVTIFGAKAATEFLRYDGFDPVVRELRWNQPTNDRFVLEVELAHAQPWGYRYGYDGTDFYLDVRRPPRLRWGLFRSVLKGLKIVVDPGHSPDPGAVGPTGLAEKDANLGAALELARELEDRGARVIMTRDVSTPPDSTPGLNDRTNLAARLEADLLVSVHHNALPDGVNPFESNGTSVYYYHPQSLPLARAVQRELVRALELRDLGIGIGNLALVRPTEMPAVLTESAFMMIPEQEELLRTDEFRKREAKAIRKGIERFLKALAKRSR